jgi:uncharacterized protein (TIGR00255 family)
MTGFGQGSVISGSLTVTSEIRSVNNRFLDITLRLPRELAPLDQTLRRLAAAGLERGKVEIRVTLEGDEAAGKTLAFERPLVEAALEALLELERLTGEKIADKAALLFSLPGFFEIKETESGTDKEEPVKAAFDLALADLVRARSEEGNALAADLLGYADELECALSDVEQAAPCVVERYRERLSLRIEELLAENGQLSLDEGRLASEVALFADKAAVDEEIARLKSHISRLRQILKDPGPHGKKLDFLCQELNREVNTIGSKANDTAVTDSVLTMKTVVEKIREQVQNIE